MGVHEVVISSIRIEKRLNEAILPQRAAFCDAAEVCALDGEVVNVVGAGERAFVEKGYPAGGAVELR